MKDSENNGLQEIEILKWIPLRPNPRISLLYDAWEKGIPTGKAKEIIEKLECEGLKAVSWRIIVTSTTMFLVYVFTGRLELTATVGFFDVVLKILFYFLGERSWNRIESDGLVRGRKKGQTKKRLSPSNSERRPEPFRH